MAELDYYVRRYKMTYATNGKTHTRYFFTEEEALRHIRAVRSLYFVSSLSLLQEKYADVTHLLGRCGE